MAAPTPRERDEERRKERLAEMKQMIKDGTLTVRRLSPEELEKQYPRKQD